MGNKRTKKIKIKIKIHKSINSIYIYINNYVNHYFKWLSWIEFLNKNSYYIWYNRIIHILFLDKLHKN